MSSSGRAGDGRHAPVVAVYATFLNRAFDQALMDVAPHRLPVTFVLDRAGVTSPDGPSHHGMWDLSLLAMVPGMRVACPRDADVGVPARQFGLGREFLAHGSREEVLSRAGLGVEALVERIHGLLP